MSAHRMNGQVRQAVLELRWPSRELTEAAIVAFWTQAPYNLRQVLQALDAVEARALRLRAVLEALESRGEEATVREPEGTFF